MKKREYRIMEVSNKDTDIGTWFYPQRLLEVKLSTGYLWWKKTETKQEWCLFYDIKWSKEYPVVLSQQRRDQEYSEGENPKVVGFRTYDEAKSIIDKHEARVKIIHEDYYREELSKVKEGSKIHEVK